MMLPCCIISTAPVSWWPWSAKSARRSHASLSHHALLVRTQFLDQHFFQEKHRRHHDAFDVLLASLSHHALLVRTIGHHDVSEVLPASFTHHAFLVRSQFPDQHFQ